MGTPIALQGLWRTADMVEPARLRRLHDALRSGALGRRVVRSRVPGARDRWQLSSRAHPLEVHSAALPPEEILSWADGQGTELDPERGPGWRLSAAPLTDGGTIVALTCSHVLADARGLIIAVEAALSVAERRTPAAGAVPGDEIPADLPGPGGDPDSDWADAAETWATVLTGTARAVRNRIWRATSASDAVGVGPSSPERIRVDHGAVAGTGQPRGSGPPIPGRDMAPGGDSALSHGDTAARHNNTDLRYGKTGSAPEEAVGSRSAPAGEPRPATEPGIVPLNLPTGRRGANDHLRPGHGQRPVDRALSAGFRENSRANDRADPVTPQSEVPVPGIVLRCPAGEWERVAAAAGGTANSLFIWFVANTLWAAGFPGRRIVASLPVDTRDEQRIDNDLAMTEIAITPGDDPADIRAQSRAAYEYRMSSPGGLPEEFLHLVPDRVAYRLSRGAGERDILCSNIGAIPPALHSLGPNTCTGVAARAIHPGLTYDRRPRTRLSGYLCRFRDDYLLTLVSLDPARAADPGTLRHLAERTADRLGVPIAEW